MLQAGQGTSCSLNLAFRKRRKLPHSYPQHQKNPQNQQTQPSEFPHIFLRRKKDTDIYSKPGNKELETLLVAQGDFSQKPRNMHFLNMYIINSFPGKQF